MRILMIAPTAFFSSRGGHLRIMGEAVTLSRSGHSVPICTFGVGNNVDGVKILRGRLQPRNFHHGPSKLRALLDLDLMLVSIRSLIAERPDVIHCHLHEGAAIGEILSLFSGIPIVLDTQGSISEESVYFGLTRRNSILHIFLRAFEMVTLRRANIVLLSSRQLLETYRSWLPERQHSKLKLVLDGFDTSRFTPIAKDRDLQKRLGIEENKKVVVYLGSLEKQQGISTMIEAARQVSSQKSDVHFLIMGTPVDVSLDECRQIAEKCGVSKQITFLGTVPYEVAAKHLSLGDVAMSAKISSSESNGKICVYMAMGIPTACFDTSVNRDLLGDLGFFAREPTADSLAQQIMAALSISKEHRDKLRSQLSKRANDFASWNSMVSVITDSYRQVLK